MHIYTPGYRWFMSAELYTPSITILELWNPIIQRNIVPGVKVVPIDHKNL